MTTTTSRSIFSSRSRQHTQPSRGSSASSRASSTPGGDFLSGLSLAPFLRHNSSLAASTSAVASSSSSMTNHSRSAVAGRAAASFRDAPRAANNPTTGSLSSRLSTNSSSGSSSASSTKPLRSRTLSRTRPRFPARYSPESDSEESRTMDDDDRDDGNLIFVWAEKEECWLE